MSWSHYLFGFDGRINRAKMWAIYLVLLVVEIPAAVVGRTLGPQRLDEVFRGPPWSLAAAASAAFFAITAGAIFWFTFAIIVKRLHDRNKSAWWLLFFYGFPAGIFAFLLTWGRAAQGSPAFVLTFLVLLATNLWYLAELFLLRGTEGPNRFGRDPLASPASKAAGNPNHG